MSVFGVLLYNDIEVLHSLLVFFNHLVSLGALMDVP